ncbi:MAG: UpxY family transcription antiterminator [Candidatus Limimorpha sp.]
MSSSGIIKWYAIYVVSRHEKKVAKLLTEQNVETFLPLIKRLKQWSDRKKMVEEPLFKSYLFVRTDLKNYFDILHVPGVVHFICFDGKPLEVPENQIAAVESYVSDFVDDNDNCLPDLHEGQLVEIKYGQMKGLVGRFISMKGKQRVIVNIEAVGQFLPINISRSQVTPIVND